MGRRDKGGRRGKLSVMSGGQPAVAGQELSAKLDEAHLLDWTAVSKDILAGIPLAVIAQKHHSTLGEIRHVQRWSYAKARALLRRDRAIDARAVVEEITLSSLAGLRDDVRKANGLTQGEYAQDKIRQTHLKGVGIYKLGEEHSGGMIGTQNNFLLLVKSEEDAKRIIEQAARSEVGQGTYIRAITAGAGENPGADQDGPSVVVPELHSDV